MKKTIKTLVITTTTIGLIEVIRQLKSLQTQINEIKTTQSDLESKLNLKVDKNNLIREINVTPERIRIDSSKIGSSTESLDARSVRATNIKTEDI